MLIPGKVAELTGLVISILMICYFAFSKEARKKPYAIRPIAGLDAIGEAVQRATEMGRPVLALPGTGDVSDTFATQTLAGLAVLKHTAALSAEYDTRLLVSVYRANVLPIASAVVRDAFSAEGKSDMFREDTVQWFSEEQFAFAAATQGLMEREKVAASVLTGFFRAESLLLAEASASAGAITIGGCGQVVQVPWFVVCCDYCLIGEELMVASAYLEKTPGALGVVRAQDILKIALMVMTLCGAIIGTFSKQNALVKILTK